MYKQNCKLNQIIKDNTKENELTMIPFVIHKYFGYPLYKIAVK